MSNPSIDSKERTNSTPNCEATRLDPLDEHRSIGEVQMEELEDAQERVLAEIETLTSKQYLDRYMQDYSPEKLSDQFCRDIGWVVSATMADLFRRIPRLFAYISKAEEALLVPETIEQEMTIIGAKGNVIGPRIVADKKAMAEESLTAILDFARKFANTNLEILKTYRQPEDEYATSMRKLISSLDRAQLQELQAFLEGLITRKKASSA